MPACIKASRISKFLRGRTPGFLTFQGEVRQGEMEEGERKGLEGGEVKGKGYGRERKGSIGEEGACPTKIYHYSATNHAEILLNKEC